MNAKYLAIGIGAVLAVGAIGFGRAAWRTHNDLVTLEVRNAPLADVVRKIENQTGEKVRVDPKLDATITLAVKNSPLTNVLDLLAEQAGARWGKTYAVYNNDFALRRLESVFRGVDTLDAAGWTNLAPRFSATDTPEMALAGGAGPMKVVAGSPPGTSSSGSFSFQNDEDVRKFVDEKVKDGATVTHSDDGSVKMVTRRVQGPDGERIIKTGPGTVMVQKGGPDGAPGHEGRQVMVRRMVGPSGITTTTTDGEGRVKVTKTAADGTVIKEDQWSSERLVLETPLSPRLGDAIPAKATPETAAETATKVHGHYVTYYALEKPPIPLPDAGGLVRSSFQQKFNKGGTNNPLANGDFRDRMEAEAKNRRMEELSKSPEQQVQRARRLQEAQSAK